jgi:2-keto-4-pentenoate hydratase/2-oxohepta-3-ene-1,7-dioic acid hydratase in catechol pathway
MRLVTFQKKKEKRIGVLIDNEILDLSLACKEYKVPALPENMREFLELGNSGMSRIKKILREIKSDLKKSKKPKSLTPVKSVHLCPPVDNPEKIICIGQNYIDHCREQNVEPPTRPIIFTKFNTALNGPYDPVKIPTVSDKIDYEAELAFVIGKQGKHISKEKAMDYVAGYMVLNDITARDIQKSEGQWIRGKTSDTFAPCGPALVTKDEIKNPHDLKISLKLNGTIMQDSNTCNLIFNISYLIWFISQNITLKPGDIVSTGTPPGVGFARKPPVFLKAGDVIETTVESIGTLVNYLQNE